MKVCDLSIGDRLFFGRAWLDNGRCDDLLWTKASDDNDFVITDGLGRLSIDAQEQNNENRDRRIRGSNFFLESNIFQYLNSSEISWFAPMHEHDEVDLNLKRMPGFLHFFEDWEQKAIVPHEITVIVPNGFKRKYGEQAKSMCMVSIPSKSQIYGGDDMSEGEKLMLYNSGRYPNSVVTRTTIGSGLVHGDAYADFNNHSPARRANVIPLIRINGDCDIEFVQQDLSYAMVTPSDVTEETINTLQALLG